MHETANSLPGRGTIAASADALAFAFGFVARNCGAILRRVVVPGLLGCAALYVLLSTYCTEVINFLGSPSDGMASRIMGIAAAGVLIMLLLHAIVVARLAELVEGGEVAHPAFLGIRTDAWRIYAANLRFLLALCVYGAATIGAAMLITRFGAAPGAVTAVKAVAWLLAFWLMARGWFFLVPVSLHVGDDGVLATSWRHSRGHLVGIFIVMLIVAVLTLVLLSGGEFLLRSAGVFSPVPAPLSFSDAIGFYQRNLWIFVILISLVYVPVAGFLTAASLRLHRNLVAAPPA